MGILLHKAGTGNWGYIPYLGPGIAVLSGLLKAASTGM